MSWIGAVAASRGARANRAMTAVRRKEMLQRREDLFGWNPSLVGVSEQFQYSVDKDRIRRIEAVREAFETKRRKDIIKKAVLLIGLSVLVLSALMIVV